MEKDPKKSSEKKERKVKPFTKLEIEKNEDRISQFPEDYDWDTWFADFPELVLKYKRKKETREIFEGLIVREEKSLWRERVKFRKDNKTWLRMSVEIALKIHDVLDEKKISHQEFGKLLDITEDQSVIILQGRSKLDLEMIAKIEKVLDTKIIKIEEH